MSRTTEAERRAESALRIKEDFEEIIRDTEDFDLLRNEIGNRLNAFRLELGRWRGFRDELLAKTQVLVLDCRHRDEDDWRDVESWIDGFDSAKHAAKVHLFQFWNAQPRPAVFTEHFSGGGDPGRPVLLLGTRRFESRDAMDCVVMINGDFRRPEGHEQRWGTVSRRDGIWDVRTFVPLGEREGITERVFNECMEKLLGDACATSRRP